MSPYSYTNSNNTTQLDRISRPFYLWTQRTRLRRTAHLCRVILPSETPPPKPSPVESDAQDRCTQCSPRGRASPILLTVYHLIPIAETIEAEPTLIDADASTEMPSIRRFDQIRSIWSVQEARACLSDLKAYIWGSGIFLDTVEFPTSLIAHYATQSYSPCVSHNISRPIEDVEGELKQTLLASEWPRSKLLLDSTTPSVTLMGIYIQYAQCYAILMDVDALLRVYNDCIRVTIGHAEDNFISTSFRHITQASLGPAAWCSSYEFIRVYPQCFMHEPYMGKGEAKFLRISQAQRISLKRSTHPIISNNRTLQSGSENLDPVSNNPDLIRTMQRFVHTASRQSRGRPRGTLKLIGHLLKSVFKPRRESLQSQADLAQAGTVHEPSRVSTPQLTVTSCSTPIIRYQIMQLNHRLETTEILLPVLLGTASRTEIPRAFTQQPSGEFRLSLSHRVVLFRDVCRKYESQVMRTVAIDSVRQAYVGHDAFLVQKVGTERNPPWLRLHNPLTRARTCSGCLHRPGWVRKRSSRSRDGTMQHETWNRFDVLTTPGHYSLTQHTKPMYTDFAEVTVIQSSPSLYLSVHEVPNEVTDWHQMSQTRPARSEVNQFEHNQTSHRSSGTQGHIIHGFGDVQPISETTPNPSDDGLESLSSPRSMLVAQSDSVGGTDRRSMKRTQSSSSIDSVLMESSVELTVSVSTTVTTGSDCDALTSTETSSEVDGGVADEDRSGWGYDTESTERSTISFRRTSERSHTTTTTSWQAKTVGSYRQKIARPESTTRSDTETMRTMVEDRLMKRPGAKGDWRNSINNKHQRSLAVRRTHDLRCVPSMSTRTNSDQLRSSEFRTSSSASASATTTTTPATAIEYNSRQSKHGSITPKSTTAYVALANRSEPKSAHGDSTQRTIGSRVCTGDQHTPADTNTLSVSLEPAPILLSCCYHSQRGPWLQKLH